MYKSTDSNSMENSCFTISDAEAMKIHGLNFSDGHSSDTDSGKSSFDEEYFRYKPRPLKIHRSEISIVSADIIGNGQENVDDVCDLEIENEPNSISSLKSVSTKRSITIYSGTWKQNSRKKCKIKTKDSQSKSTVVKPNLMEKTKGNRKSLHNRISGAQTLKRRKNKHPNFHKGQNNYSKDINKENPHTVNLENDYLNIETDKPFNNLKNKAIISKTRTRQSKRKSKTLDKQQIISKRLENKTTLNQIRFPYFDKTNEQRDSNIPDLFCDIPTKNETVVHKNILSFQVANKENIKKPSIETSLTNDTNNSPHVSGHIERIRKPNNNVYGYQQAILAKKPSILSNFDSHYRIELEERQGVIQDKHLSIPEIVCEPPRRNISDGPTFRRIQSVDSSNSGSSIIDFGTSALGKHITVNEKRDSHVVETKNTHLRNQLISDISYPWIRNVTDLPFHSSSNNVGSVPSISGFVNSSITQLSLSNNIKAGGDLKNSQGVVNKSTPIYSKDPKRNLSYQRSHGNIINSKKELNSEIQGEKLRNVSSTTNTTNNLNAIQNGYEDKLMIVPEIVCELPRKNRTDGTSKTLFHGREYSVDTLSSNSIKSSTTDSAFKLRNTNVANKRSVYNTTGTKNIEISKRASFSGTEEIRPDISDVKTVTCEERKVGTSVSALLCELPRKNTTDGTSKTLFHGREYSVGKLNSNSIQSSTTDSTFKLENANVANKQSDSNTTGTTNIEASLVREYSSVTEKLHTDISDVATVTNEGREVGTSESVLLCKDSYSFYDRVVEFILCRKCCK